MKNYLYTTVLGVLFLAVSCSDESTDNIPSGEKPATAAAPQFKIVQNDSLGYTIAVSDELSPASDLNAHASLQYANKTKGYYIMVLDEPITDVTGELEALGVYDKKRSFLDNFSEFRVDQMEENARSIEKGELRSKIRNGMTIRTIRLEASVNEVPETVVYYIGFAHDEQNSYMIMAWTLKSKDKEFRTIAERMIDSFSVKQEFVPADKVIIKQTPAAS